METTTNNIADNPGSHKARMNWLDAARLAAAFCIIAIHTSSDSTGGAFQTEQTPDRIFPVLLRSLAEVASTEFFILVSLFLLSLSLTKQTYSYAETMRIQARRLLVPFVVWTVFYAFFRLYKAYEFGYEHAIFSQLTSVGSWVGYLALGNVNYHMHFLPTLFLLLLFHRVYKLAIPYPLLGLSIIPMLYLNISLNGWAWGTIQDKTLLEYCVRLIKVLTYTGYGFFAYSLYGIWKRGIDQQRAKTILGLTLVFLFIGVLIKLIYAYKVGASGEFIVRRDMIFYGHYLFPCLMLVAFFSSQYYPWPEKLSNWSKYSFGMYLMHPAVIDVIDMALSEITLAPYSYVLMKYTATAFFTFCLAVAIGRIRAIAWIIGLGPLPQLRDLFRKQLTAEKI